MLSSKDWGNAKRYSFLLSFVETWILAPGPWRKILVPLLGFWSKSIQIQDMICSHDSQSYYLNLIKIDSPLVSLFLSKLWSLLCFCTVVHNVPGMQKVLRLPFSHFVLPFSKPPLPPYFQRFLLSCQDLKYNQSQFDEKHAISSATRATLTIEFSLLLFNSLTCLCGLHISSSFMLNYSLLDLLMQISILNIKPCRHRSSFIGKKGTLFGGWNGIKY